MIKQYPATMIDQLWHGDADALVSAMARNGGECTGDQLKMMLMRGELLLIGSDDLWAAVQPVSRAYSANSLISASFIPRPSRVHATA